MKLLRFRVENFRSVRDSGWSTVDDVTALIGVNESGKTNLLLPLWKLNPVREGEIEPLVDYPKAMYGEIRDNPEEFRFVTADFAVGSARNVLSAAGAVRLAEDDVVRVSRFYDGGFLVEFPGHEPRRTTDASEVSAVLREVRTTFGATTPLKTETALSQQFRQTIDAELEGIGEEPLNASGLRRIADRINDVLPDEPAKTSVIVPAMRQSIGSIREMAKEASKPAPGNRDGVREAVIEAMPRFVYYSNYGNLDSEIYLPHVVENMARADLGTKEAAKVRTLKVLFSFVRLEAEEILELGRDPEGVSAQGRKPSDEDIERAQQRKKEKSILLQSAGTELTQKFKDWWRQGDYQFRFEADGDFFRIWVKDDRRPSEVELENRSTGLQWFLSFYLIFLIESRRDNKGAVLLLDEPGMSLHPLAQKDLADFFKELSLAHQIVYTSHSPFLIDADRLDSARKVYVDGGFTKVTADLRQSSTSANERGAAYAVHSALGLTITESLLVGCRPVLVEGPSDQHYMSAIKALLISGGRIAPSQELVFPPTGGTKTARVTASILTGRDDDLPFMLLDADGPGRTMARQLRSELYATNPDRILSVANYVDFDEAEIEDLFPHAFLADELDRMERGAEERFADVMQMGKPFVGQVEHWAKANGLSLPQSWKVELSVRAKKRAIKQGLQKFEDDTVARWTDLFTAFV